MEDAIRFMYQFEELLPKSVVLNWRLEKQFWNKPVQDALDIVELEYKRPLNIVVSDNPRGKGNKYDRIVSGSLPYYQQGRIYYDENEYSNNDFQVGIAQLKDIEPGYKTHDDSPDADQQAIEYLSQFVVYPNHSSTEVEVISKRRNNRM